MKTNQLLFIFLAVAVAFLGLALKAEAFTHPCVPSTIAELDAIKASLAREPWKSGFARLAGDGRSQLTYTMQGPFVNVSRAGAYDANLGEWRNDMTAVYNLARMWYFTGNAAYAQKARDILIAWATTHTSFSGNESGLDLGDYAASFGGGASILRGTWPGWTAADTTAVQNYFANVFWPASAGWPTQGPANKGAIYLEAGIAIALICDNDTSKFDHVLNMFRTFHGTGMGDTLPTGQLGETGRDMGHAYGMLNGLVFVAECAWKQGVDLYSELDNRLLACGEYFARNAFTTDNPYVFFGSIDWQWINNAPGPHTSTRAAFYLLQNAYKNRKNLPTPWIDRKLQEPPVDSTSFMYAKTADFTTATASPASFPAVSPASSGLTLTTLGTQTAGRSVSYLDGTWTLTGRGNGVWSDTTDDCQFAYTTMTGDCAMVAKVNSFTNSATQAGKAGLMIRDNLSPAISQRALVDVTWNSSGGNSIEAHMRGWTVNWGGGGYDDRSHDWPPGLPYWIKIERRGKQITTFASPDGASWSPLTCTYYGNLPSVLHMGLFLCSGNATSVTASFSNVAFTGGTGGLVTTPAAPVGVLASGSNKAITVRWLASFGATAYDLLRSSTSGSGYTVLASDLTAARTSYVDTDVSPGTTYYYVVQAKNSAGTSGNSPEFGAALLPAPMVSLAFSGTSTAGFNSGPGSEGSNKAFDGDPGSKWYGYNAPAGWIQYDFGADNAQVVQRYTINSADVPARDPKDWSLLGSQDGSSWTSLDSQDNQLFATRMSQNTYDIGNSTAYRYYRLDITANNGATGVAVAELGLWGGTGRTIPDGRYRIVSRHSNKVMDVAGGATANGAPLVQQTYNGSNSQLWDIAWQGHGQYRVTHAASSWLMDNGGTANAGSHVVIQPSSAGTRQLWRFVPGGDGFLHLTSENSGLVPEVSGSSADGGANLVQALYSGSDNQLWMPSLGTQPPPPPPSPHTDLKFDEASGASAADATGNGWNGTLVNGGTRVAGFSNNAVNLDSASSQYITLPAGVLSSLDDFTISAWVRLTTVSNWSRLFDFGTGTSVNMFLTPSNGATNVIRFALTLNGGGSEQRIDGTAALPAGVWKHVAVTLSGSTGVLYVDGVPVGVNNAMTLKPGDLGTTTQNYIGRSQYSDPYLNGQVDEFRIYRGALSAGEVATLVTPLTAPQNLTATPGSAQVALTWSAVANASSYVVKSAPASSGPWTTRASGVTATSYTDTGLADGTTYYYIASAVNAVAEGPGSAPASATPLSPIQAWRQQHFGTIANTGAAADTADTDGDGLANLIEYATGSSPTTSSPSPFVSSISGGFLTCTVAKADVTGLTWSAESCDDVTSWSPANVIVLTDSATTFQVRDNVPAGSSGRRFLRLKITRP